METQLLRVSEQLENLDLPIDKYIYLTGLLDTNETLFFKTVISDPAKFLPLVYTPTVGEACERLGHIARRPRRLFISIKNKQRIATLRSVELFLRTICYALCQSFPPNSRSVIANRSIEHNPFWIFNQSSDASCFLGGIPRSL